MGLLARTNIPLKQCFKVGFVYSHSSCHDAWKRRVEQIRSYKQVVAQKRCYLLRNLYSRFCSKIPLACSTTLNSGWFHVRDAQSKSFMSSINEYTSHQSHQSHHCHHHLDTFGHQYETMSSASSWAAWMLGYLDCFLMNYENKKSILYLEAYVFLDDCYRWASLCAKRFFCSVVMILSSSSYTEGSPQ